MKLSYKGSITALEKNADRLQIILEKQGYIVNLDVAKGWSNCPFSGYTSSVTVEVEKGAYYNSFTIEANGYGDTKPWKVIKEYILYWSDKEYRETL